MISHIGARPNHEDNFLLGGRMILPPKQAQMTQAGHRSVSFHREDIRGDALFAVSDGMGGHNAGEVASFLAMECLHGETAAILGAGDPVVAFQSAVGRANAVILGKGRGNPEMDDMGATLSALMLIGPKAVVFSLGDSRVYRYDGAGLARITEDHTEGRRMLRLGLMTEEEVRRFPSRKSLNRYLGLDMGGGMPDADVFEMEVTRGTEWFLLCSDGLTDSLADDRIEGILGGHFGDGDVAGAVRGLVKAAVGAADGSGDNVTAMIVGVAIG